MNTEFRERLKLVVARAKGNQGTKALAVKLGLALGTVQGWENGTSIPSIENLKRLSALLGCKPSDLLKYLEGEEDLTEKSEQIIESMKCLPKDRLALIVKTGVEMLTVS